jgi:hypothetical protein
VNLSYNNICNASTVLGGGGITVNAYNSVALTSDMNDVNLTANSGNVNLSFSGGLYMSNGGAAGYFTVDNNGYLWWYNTVTAYSNQLTSN